MEFSTLNGYKVKDKKAIRFYDTVDDMINDITLKEGMHAKTKGYYSVNDGGASEYHITVTESNSDYQEELDNGLYATLVIKDYVTPEMFGCYGDGVHDDTLNLQTAINTEKTIHASKNYLISDELEIKNSFIMSGNSYIICGESVTEIGVSIAKGTQRNGNQYIMNIDGQGYPETTVAIYKPRKCNFDINVINAGETGINCNYLAEHGNGANIFDFHVIGNPNGTTEKGVVVNCFDSLFENIGTQDCKYGVYLYRGELIARCLHSWISDDLASTLWSDSCVLYDANYYHFKIDWLYQDGVRYGVTGNAPYGIIDFFEFTNNLTNADTLYNNDINVKNISGNMRLTINRFCNDKNENKRLSYDLGTSSNGSEFGITYKNGVGNVHNQLTSTQPFSDCDNAPQIGIFGVKYDTLNLPVDQGGNLICEVIGTATIQTFYSNNYASTGFFWKRIRLLNNDTWGNWYKYTPTTE